jgi:hypothetical protein
MTIMALAMAMNLATKGDALDNARKALNNCFVEEHNKAVVDKKSGAEFNEQMASACPEPRKAYHDLIVKLELSYKSKPADAEQYANDEVQAVIDSITAAFSENVSSGARLQPEK